MASTPIPILCFGSTAVAGDDIALKVARKARIPGIRFVVISSPERVMDFIEKDFFILDAARGITEPHLIDDVSLLDPSKLVSLHDFDLGFFLKLTCKLKPGLKLRIIAVPLGCTVAQAAQAVRKFALGK